jgi:histidine triad (HIT) family protein
VTGETADDCVFCEIVAGRQPASIVYESDGWVGFMDLRQQPHGHVIIVPRRHIRNILDLDDETGATLTPALRRVAQAVYDVFVAEGISIAQANEPPWQEVFHLHFHVYPRYVNVPLLRVYPGGFQSPKREELDRQASLIREALGPSP